MRIKLTLPAPPEGYYQEFYDFLKSFLWYRRIIPPDQLTFTSQSCKLS